MKWVFGVFIFLISISTWAAEPWSLTNDERRAFLQGYAPMILGQAQEDQGKFLGHSWISNFYFDNDNDFSNNSLNWLNLSRLLADGQELKLQPTLYTAIIEYMEEGQKSLNLLYHVYRPRDARSIHDWERIELRLDGVTRKPLGGETVAYVTVTNHRIHQTRQGHQVQYYETSTGRHPLVYQASWRQKTLASLRKHEIEFVEEGLETWLHGSSNEIRISDVGDSPAHYIFVEKSDEEAVEQLAAQELNEVSAWDLYSGRSFDERTALTEVQRIQYELQDLADILPTHWQSSASLASPSWEEAVPILMDETPLTDHRGEEVIPTSAELQGFLRVARSQRGEDKERKGYPDKHWFWGAYVANQKSIKEDALKDQRKYEISGRPSKLPFRGKTKNYFWQHDYMTHSAAGENYWLPASWQKPEFGGFDGRWRQLFAPSEQEPTSSENTEETQNSKRGSK